MEYLSNAIDALKADDAMFKKSIIGGLLMILSILIIPAFFIQGYMVQILKDTKQPTLETYPAWDDWGNLFVMGLIAFVINLVFTIPTQLLIYAPELMGASGQNPSSGASVLMLIGYLISFIVGYITPIIYAMYFRDNGVVTDFNRFKDIALSTEYLIAYVVVFALAFGVGLAMVFLIIFTLGLGLLAVPFLYFPVQCVSMYILGAAITEADPEATPHQDEEENNEPDVQKNEFSVEYE